MIAAILIGRKGSTGFPGKNTSHVLGRALCKYPLLAAQYSKHVSKTFLSTDDEDIKKIGQRYGVTIIERPAYLATKEALGEDAYIHALKVIREDHLTFQCGQAKPGTTVKSSGAEWTDASQGSSPDCCPAGD